MNVIERNNVRVYGSSAQTIVFAHGYGCDQKIWSLVAPAFYDEHEVILFDHVGAGESDISQYNRSKYGSLDGYAEDLLEIAHCLDLEDAIFVGHSVSSMIGLLASIHDPKVFSKLILIGPSPCYFNDGDYQGGFTREAIEAMLKIVDSNYEAWAKAMVPVIMGNLDRPELSEQLLQSFCSAPPDIAQHFAQVTFLSDNRKDLPLVRTPSVILQCSADSIAPEYVGHYMHRCLDNSELKILQATGHCPHVSAPGEVIAAMRSSLGIQASLYQDYRALPREMPSRSS